MWDEIDPEYERVDVEGVGTFSLAKPVELPRGYEMEDSESWNKCAIAFKRVAIEALKVENFEKVRRLEKQFDRLREQFKARYPQYVLGDGCLEGEDYENYDDYIHWVSLQDLNQYLGRVTVGEELCAHLEESVAIGRMVATDRRGRKFPVNSKSQIPLAEIVKIEFEVVTHYDRVPEDYMGV